MNISLFGSQSSSMNWAAFRALNGYLSEQGEGVRVATSRRFLRGPSIGGEALSSRLVQHCLSFLGERECRVVACVSRALQKEVVPIVIELCNSIGFYSSLKERMSHEALISVETVLAIREQLTRHFDGCESLLDADQRIHQIKQYIVINLSRLSSSQLMSLECSFNGEEIPSRFRDVFYLAAERNRILTTIQNNDRSSLAAAVDSRKEIEEIVDFIGQNEFFKDDEAIAYAFIEWYKGLPKGMHQDCRWEREWLILSILNERLQNKDSLMLEILREFEETRLMIVKERLSPRLKENEGFMLALLAFFPDAIHSASEGLRNRGSFMFEAIKAHVWMIGKIGKQLAQDVVFMRRIAELTNDSTFMLASIRANNQAAQHIGLELRKNETFMLTLLEINPQMALLASEGLKNSSKFMHAVRKKSLQIALHCLGETLQDDEAFMSALCRQNPAAVFKASERLRDLSRFMSPIFELGDARFLTKYLGEKLRDNEAFMLPLCLRDKSLFEWVSPRLAQSSHFYEAVWNVKKPGVPLEAGKALVEAPHRYDTLQNRTIDRIYRESDKAFNVAPGRRNYREVAEVVDWLILPRQRKKSLGSLDEVGNPFAGLPSLEPETGPTLEPDNYGSFAWEMNPFRSSYSISIAPTASARLAIVSKIL